MRNFDHISNDTKYGVTIMNELDVVNDLEWWTYPLTQNYFV